MTTIEPYLDRASQDLRSLLQIYKDALRDASRKKPSFIDEVRLIQNHEDEVILALLFDLFKMFDIAIKRCALDPDSAWVEDGLRKFYDLDFERLVVIFLKKRWKKREEKEQSLDGDDMQQLEQGFGVFATKSAIILKAFADKHALNLVALDFMLAGSSDAMHSARKLLAGIKEDKKPFRALGVALRHSPASIRSTVVLKAFHSTKAIRREADYEMKIRSLIEEFFPAPNEERDQIEALDWLLRLFLETKATSFKQKKYTTFPTLNAFNRAKGKAVKGKPVGTVFDFYESLSRAFPRVINEHIWRNTNLKPSSRAFIIQQLMIAGGAVNFKSLYSADNVSSVVVLSKKLDDALDGVRRRFDCVQIHAKHAFGDSARFLAFENALSTFDPEERWQDFVLPFEESNLWNYSLGKDEDSLRFKDVIEKYFVAEILELPFAYFQYFRYPDSSKSIFFDRHIFTNSLFEVWKRVRIAPSKTFICYSKTHGLTDSDADLKNTAVMGIAWEIPRKESTDELFGDDDDGDETSSLDGKTVVLFFAPLI